MCTPVYGAPGLGRGSLGIAGVAEVLCHGAEAEGGGCLAGSPLSTYGII